MPNPSDSEREREFGMRGASLEETWSRGTDLANGELRTAATGKKTGDGPIRGFRSYMLEYPPARQDPDRRPRGGVRLMKRFYVLGLGACLTVTAGGWRSTGAAPQDAPPLERPAAAAPDRP